MLRKLIESPGRKLKVKGNIGFVDGIKASSGVSAAGGEIVDGIDVVVALGDITKLQNADAIVVPHFEGSLSEKGVAGGVLSMPTTDKEAAQIEEAFDQVAKDIQNAKYGDAFITTGFAKKQPKSLIHVVTAEPPADRAFKITSDAVFNALVKANKAGIETIAFPAINTGFSGTLTSQQSAQAIYDGINRYFAQVPKKDRTIKGIAVVVYQVADPRYIRNAPDDVAKTSYGPRAYSVFHQELARSFKKKVEISDIDPEYVASRRVISDIIQQITGDKLTDDQRNELSTLILHQAPHARTALGQDFIRDMVQEMGKKMGFKFTDAQFKKYLDSSCAVSVEELDVKIRELESKVLPQKKKIQEMAEAFGLDANDEKFGPLNEKIREAEELLEDCKVLKKVFKEINQKLIDEAEFNELKEKYEEALDALKGQERARASVEKELRSVQRERDQLEREVERLKDLHRQSNTSSIHSSSARSGFH